MVIILFPLSEIRERRKPGYLADILFPGE